MQQAWSFTTGAAYACLPSSSPTWVQIGFGLVLVPLLTTCAVSVVSLLYRVEAFQKTMKQGCRLGGGGVFAAVGALGKAVHTCSTLVLMRSVWTTRTELLHAKDCYRPQFQHKHNQASRPHLCPPRLAWQAGGLLLEDALRRHCMVGSLFQGLLRGYIGLVLIDTAMKILYPQQLSECLPGLRRKTRPLFRLPYPSP